MSNSHFVHRNYCITEAFECACACAYSPEILATEPTDFTLDGDDDDPYEYDDDIVSPKKNGDNDDVLDDDLLHEGKQQI